MDIGDDLNEIAAKLMSSADQTEQLSYLIWGAAVTTTRAFDKVTLRIDGNTNRVFVSIKLRWWAKIKRLEPIRKAWLARAEERCSKLLPEGWRILIYYDGGTG